MKQNRYTVGLFFLTVCAVLSTLFFSCENSLITESDKSYSDNNANMVILRVATTTPASRIVMPEEPSVASYRLFGTIEGGSIQELGEWDSLTDATVTLAVGTWDFTLDAYDGSGNLVLEGKIDARQISGGATLSFELSLVETGTGSVQVTILWPYLDGLVASVATTFNGNLVEPALEPVPAPPAGLAAVFEQTDVAAGDYLITFKLLDLVGKVVCTRSEWVLVRRNVQSEGTILVDASAFNRAPESPANCGTIDEEALGWSSLSFTLAWSDSSDNETGFLVESSEDGETWVTETSVGAGVRTYPTSLKRGESRAYRISAFNDFGFSEPATTDYEVPALIDLMTSDSDIMTVTVNMWDPATLAFHGTFEFTRNGSFFKGGGEPTTLGPQLIQAYAYDAEGKIRGVAEATETIDEITDRVTMIIQPARLMGGNVQKTGGSIGDTPVYITNMENGIDPMYVGGTTCDGLNLYLTYLESYNPGEMQVIRIVLSSRVKATFIGRGVGEDEDNPGNSPVFDFNKGPLTCDGTYIYLADNADPEYGNRINRISLTASRKKLDAQCDYRIDSVTWLYVSPIAMTTDGTYLYVADTRIHRIELSTNQVSRFDPSTWSWTQTLVTDEYTDGGITTDGETLYWSGPNNAGADGKIYTTPIGGGSRTILSSPAEHRLIGLLTDGDALYQLLIIDWVGSGVYSRLSTSTGAETHLANITYSYDANLASDGLSMFDVVY